MTGLYIAIGWSWFGWYTLCHQLLDRLEGGEDKWWRLRYYDPEARNCRYE